MAHAILLVVLAALAAPSAAQPDPAGTAPGSAWVPPEEVPIRSEALVRQLKTSRPDAAAHAAIERIERELPGVAHDVKTVVDRATEAVRRAVSPIDLSDIETELADVATPLRRWKAALAAEGERVAKALDDIARDTALWSATRARPETAAAGDAVVQGVERSIAALDRTAQTLTTWRARMLAISVRVLHRDAAADLALANLQATMAAERANLLVPDRSPLWAPGLGEALRHELPRVPGELRGSAVRTVAYARRDIRPFLLQAFLGILLAYVVATMARQAHKRLPADDSAVRLLERPYSVALLLALIASPAFHPLAPRRFMELMALAALVPTVRIVSHVSGRTGFSTIASVFVVLLIERFRLAVWMLPAVERVTFLVTVATGFGVAVYMARGAATDPTPWRRRAARAAAATLALALVAEIGGWTQLASLAGRGTIAFAVAALFAWATVLSLAALVAAALASRPVQRSHLFDRNAVRLRQHGELVVRLCCAVLLVYLVATALGLRDALAGALAAVLGAGLSVGALSLSVGGVLAFFVTVAGAFVFAQLVIGVLEEDVYPRTQLPRGVPYALSTIVRYAVYALGFLFALAAAGVRLDQVAILVGGLGIGIGLGLQDIVKNFAAGLTLLLERRVHPGDALEMPSQGVSGHVLSIGLRASVIRGYNGAEAVVPNGDLVSNAVTNWTLSDRLCRVEVAVGIAYGNDPEAMIVLLRDTAAATGCFLAEPPPGALFKGFGDNSLDFVVRAWTDQGYERMQALTSTLGCALHRRLTDAGIDIPFPQRTVHLGGVSAEARALLSHGRGDG